MSNEDPPLSLQVAGVAGPASHFDQLYAASNDPWNYSDSWYEQRKRAILTGILPRPTFRAAYEPGCGNGELTLALAPRCERLLASDFCQQAVDIARERTAHLPQVSVRRESLPEQWPALSSTSLEFELVVLSELCYYFDPMQLIEVSALAVASLTSGGHLLACHWKKEFEDRLQPTRSMHGLLDRNGRLRRMACYEDDDFLLDLWEKH